MFDDQTLTLVLLGIIAPVGAIDAVYFHLWRFRLAQRPESRAETVTHISRSLILGIVAVTLAFYDPRGAWYFAIAGLLAFDFVNNVVDAFLEGDSRKDLGGVPRAEYVIHIAGATWVGAASLAFVGIGWQHAFAPTELVAVSLPPMLVGNMVLVGVGSFALAAVEAALLLRAPAAATLPSARWSWLQTIPSRFILFRSVLGFRSRSSAAPPLPAT